MIELYKSNNEYLAALAGAALVNLASNSKDTK